MKDLIYFLDKYKATNDIRDLNHAKNILDSIFIHRKIRG